MMHLIAVNDQVSDGSLGVGTVYRNAKPVAAASRCITAWKIVLDVMNVILQKFYMGAGSGTAVAKRGEPMFGGAEVANFKAFDSHVTLVMNGENAASAGGSEMPCVQGRRLARIASESNVPIARVARCVDAHEFFVDSSSHVYSTARTRGVCGMLNRAPRCRLCTRI